METVVNDPLPKKWLTYIWEPLQKWYGLNQSVLHTPSWEPHQGDVVVAAVRPVVLVHHNLLHSDFLLVLLQHQRVIVSNPHYVVASVVAIPEMESCFPHSRREHCRRFVSFPEQITSSSQMGPELSSDWLSFSIPALFPYLHNTELPANHMRVQLRPAVVTDRAPLACMIDLQAALVTALPTCEPQCTLCALVFSPGTFWALFYREFISRALYFIQQHGARAFSKKNKPKTKLPTDNFSICVIPLVITDCAPLATMIDFHSSFMGIAPTGQPDRSEYRAWEQTQDIEQFNMVSDVCLKPSALPVSEPGYKKGMPASLNKLSLLNAYGIALKRYSPSQF
ncbi:hypothetical protein DV515_00012634 [Chloebia gouldiae]|uniref:Uncharacterized protein n=1 Tax=Chloebia gouldiae TaxID=44316 RepID=A0A3L8S365_CHLGU|nr:hypothetical protein DV515_00012634 [Chloebia gouldiae]